MKVIRKGPPAKEPYKFTCKGCKSILEVTAEDGTLTADRDGRAYVFKCVVCKTDNWIEASLLDVPRRWAAADPQQ